MNELSEPLSEEELVEIAGWWEIWDSLNERERRGKMKRVLEVAGQDIPRLIATIRKLQEANRD